MNFLDSLMSDRQGSRKRKSRSSENTQEHQKFLHSVSSGRKIITHSTQKSYLYKSCIKVVRKDLNREKFKKELSSKGHFIVPATDHHRHDRSKRVLASIATLGSGNKAAENANLLECDFESQHKDKMKSQYDHQKAIADSAERITQSIKAASSGQAVQPPRIQSLVSLFSGELMSPVSRARRAAQLCLASLAKFHKVSVSKLLHPYRGILHRSLFGKSLRTAMKAGKRIGIMKATTYCLSIKPPLFRPHAVPELLKMLLDVHRLTMNGDPDVTFASAKHLSSSTTSTSKSKAQPLSSRGSAGANEMTPLLAASVNAQMTLPSSDNYPFEMRNSVDLRVAAIELAHAAFTANPVRQVSIVSGQTPYEAAHEATQKAGAQAAAAAAARSAIRSGSTSSETSRSAAQAVANEHVQAQLVAQFAALGNLRNAYISIFVQSLISRSQEVSLAAERGLEAMINQRKEKTLPKDLLQYCLRPVLLNLADHCKLSLPLLNGLAKLLQLLSSCFNTTLGRKLMEHLSQWTSPSNIMKAKKLARGRRT
jgi:hypothetical protein